MANQFSPCKICALPPELREWTETEFLVHRHSLSRVGERLGINKASLFRHWRRHRRECIPMRLSAQQKQHRAPDYFDTRVFGVLGEYFSKGYDPDAQRRGDTRPLPLVEIEVTFEEPVQRPGLLERLRRVVTDQGQEPTEPQNGAPEA